MVGGLPQAGLVDKTPLNQTQVDTAQWPLQFLIFDTLRPHSSHSWQRLRRMRSCRLCVRERRARTLRVKGPRSDFAERFLGYWQPQ